jgi:hypothetical protein
MPSNDSPGVRPIATQAIEARDKVWACGLRHDTLLVLNGSPIRSGETLEVPRRRVDALVERGFVKRLD